MAQKEKGKKRKEQGRWNEVLTQNNMTDPNVKDRNNYGFPDTPSSASGILRKKFIEFVNSVKKNSTEQVNSTLREARKTFLTIVISIAASFGPADLTAVILGSAYYEAGPYKSRGVTLTKTNQFIQGKYCKNFSTRSDIGTVSVKDAKDLGFQQILALSNCLLEASCQVSKRNEGKSAFKVSKGYKGKKKYMVPGNKESLYDHTRELVTSNSVAHFYSKSAIVEKHNLPTLSRILQTCVCPSFSPKDYKPGSEDEVEVRRDAFMKVTDQYYSSVFHDTLKIMINARSSVQEERVLMDEDFHCIFDGEFEDGQLISSVKSDGDGEYTNVNRCFSGIVNSFQAFILESSMKFRARGEQYFDSQRKLFASEGGLDSNKGMMNYGFALPILLAEGGVYMGDEEAMNISKDIYDRNKAVYPELELPEISVRFISDQIAMSDPEFSESGLVKKMDTGSLPSGDSTLEPTNFPEIYETLNSDTKWDVSGQVKFNKIAVVVNDEDFEKDADVKAVSKLYDERNTTQRVTGSVQPGDHEAYEALKLKREANDGKLGEDEEAKYQELHSKIQLLRKSMGQRKMIPGCLKNMVFKDEEATIEYLRKQRNVHPFTNVVFTYPLFDLLIDIKAKFVQEPDAEGRRLADVIKDRPKPCVEFEVFLSNTGFMDGVNLEPKQKAALTTVCLAMDQSSYKDIPLDAQGEAIYHSIQNVVWEHLMLDEHLTKSHTEQIEEVFSRVKMAIINLLSVCSTITHVEKEGLIRYAMSLFFAISQPSEGEATVGLVSEMTNLPIRCDMDLATFLNLCTPDEVMSPIMLSACDSIGRNMSDALQFMKSEVAEQAKPNHGDKKRKKIFGYENKGQEFNLTTSKIAGFCMKKGIHILQRKDPDPDCVFHTIAVITRSKQKPGNMRKEVHDAVKNSHDYDDFFLMRVDPQHHDRVLKTKEQWLEEILKPQTYGDEVVMHYFMTLYGKETVAYHTDGYQVVFNENMERSNCHLLCVDSITCYPVGVTGFYTLDDGNLDKKIEELRKFMSIPETPDEDDGSSKKWEKEFSEKNKKDLKNAIMGEVRACQPECDNIGYQRYMTVGDKDYKPEIIKADKEGDNEKEDWEVEFIHDIGRYTFKFWITSLVDDMIAKEYGITFGRGWLVQDYSYAEDKDKAFSASKVTIKKLNDKLEKEKGDQAAESSGDPGSSQPKQDQEADVDDGETGGGRPQEEKVVGDYPSARKMCFSTEVLYVEKMTYIRICIAIVSCVSIFYQRQTLNMEHFTMDTVSWMEKRVNTGLSEQIWKNLFTILQRNMKKYFTKDDLYLYPLLNRKNNILGAVGSASLMPTELSYLMNGGENEKAFERLCNVCVMSCKADIPEVAVHPIHQYILNSLRRDLFLSNKTNFTADLWSYVKFEDEDDPVYKSFQKGKPKQDDGKPEKEKEDHKEEDKEEEEDDDDEDDE